MIPNTSVLNHDSLMNVIRRHSLDKKSGTIMLVTHGNQLVRILFDNGEIVALASGALHGMDAIPFIQQLDTCRAKISEKKVGAFRNVVLPSTDELLQMFARQPDSDTIETSIQPGSDAGRQSAERNLKSEDEFSIESLSSNQFAGAFKIIETELVEFIGPMARIVWAENLGKNGVPADIIALADLLNTVASEIGDPAKIKRFKEIVWQKIKNG